MADPIMTAPRIGPLEGRQGAPELGLVTAPPMTRLILRGRDAALAAAQGPLGFSLPREACRSAGTAGTHALWLGPDEWLILSSIEDGREDALSAAMGALPHSLVDVSHRQTAIVVAGPRVEAHLATICALDLSLESFPVGMCTRTLMGKAEVVLWRMSQTAFHLEVWRSFSPYLWDLLELTGQHLP